MSLSLLTSAVARKGHATKELIERLVGSWVHAIMFRRPVFSVIDQVFREGSGLVRNEVFKLSAQARNELLMLSCLSPALLTDLRASYDQHIYCLNASPTWGAVCAANVGPKAAAELWRHGELRGYHTKLESEVSALLTEKGIPHAGDKVFGVSAQTPEELLSHPCPDPFLPRPLSEGVLFDAIELFRGTGTWSASLERAGLRVHDGYDIDGRRLRKCDMLDKGVCHELLALALRRVVREWHCGMPCTSFGSLRRPPVRNHAQPAGFNLSLQRVASWLGEARSF